MTGGCGATFLLFQLFWRSNSNKLRLRADHDSEGSMLLGIQNRDVLVMQIRPKLSVLYVFLTYEEFSVITFHYAMLCN